MPCNSFLSMGNIRFMKSLRNFTTGIRRKARRIESRWDFKLRHSVNVIRTVTKTLSAITFIMSVVCVLFLIAYGGYDHEPGHLKMIIRCLHGIQAVFVLNVAYNIVFNMRTTLRDTRVIKWVVDISILLSTIPLFYPEPQTPWIHWLARLLYSNKFFLIAMLCYAVVDICYGIIRVMGKRTNPSLMLSCSFLFFIFIGSFLLMMPRCTLVDLSYIDSLFVATSAVCITGLTTIDVASTFTPLGLLVLGLLIQIGALGVMTFTSFFALFFSGNTSIYSQLMVKDMIYSKSVNALLPTLLYIFLFTIVIEAIGAVAIWLSVYDVLDMPLEEQIIFSVFHSVSAFSNAGFSNLPGGMSNPALMNSNQSIYIVVSVIVFAGSVGFPILVNFRDAFIEYLRRIWNRLRGRRRAGHAVHIYNLNTKVALYATLIIFAVSVVVFFLLERNNSLAGFSLYDQIAQSIFNSTTPRSSGFTSVNPAGFLNVTLVFVLFLMWIGGASQSTAGGIKVNTFAAILINLRAIVLGRTKVTAFNRTIATASIRRANAVVTLSIISYTLFAITLMLLEPGLPARSLLFEVSSAIFTVGSSLGVTPMLSEASKALLIGAMFLGRVGIISLLIGVTGNRRNYPVQYPTDNLIIN